MWNIIDPVECIYICVCVQRGNSSGRRPHSWDQWFGYVSRHGQTGSHSVKWGGKWRHTSDRVWRRGARYVHKSELQSRFTAFVIKYRRKRIVTDIIVIKVIINMKCRALLEKSQQSSSLWRPLNCNWQRQELCIWDRATAPRVTLIQALPHNKRIGDRTKW